MTSVPSSSWEQTRDLLCYFTHNPVAALTFWRAPPRPPPEFWPRALAATRWARSVGRGLSLLRYPWWSHAPLVCPWQRGEEDTMFLMRYQCIECFRVLTQWTLSLWCVSLLSSLSREPQTKSRPMRAPGLTLPQCAGALLHDPRSSHLLPSTGTTCHVDLDFCPLMTIELYQIISSAHILNPTISQNCVLMCECTSRVIIMYMLISFINHTDKRESIYYTTPCISS